MSTALKRPAARLAVLASGRGSHLRNLYKACAQGILDAEICLVVSNNVRSGAWHFASSEDLPHWFCNTSADVKRSAVDKALADCLLEHRIDWVITAGYLKKIGPSTLAAFPNKIINIHPALLPNYGGAGMYGQNVHRAVLAANSSDVQIDIFGLSDPTGYLRATSAAILRFSNLRGLAIFSG